MRIDLLEEGLRLGNQGVDLFEQLAELLLVQAQVFFDGLRQYPDARISCLVQEQLGNETGQGHATGEQPVLMGRGNSAGVMAGGYGLFDAFREISALE